MHIKGCIYVKGKWDNNKKSSVYKLDINDYWRLTKIQTDKSTGFIGNFPQFLY